MEILVSGSTGFVGTNLMKYLKTGMKNASVIALNLRTDWKKSITQDTTAIVHLAGKAHDLKQSSAPDAYYEVNYELSKSLFDAFIASDATHFIFVSSVKAAADSVAGILDEDMVPQPATDYGKSKLMAEEYMLAMPLPEGKFCYILRPCMIHGPLNKGNLNLLYQVVRKGIPYPLAAFNNSRSFLSVENLCFVVRELITGNIASGIYNVSDDEPLSTSQVVGILAASLDRKPRLWKIPAGMIRFIARAGDLLHLPLTTERLDKLTENYVVSNRKILSAIQKQLPLSAREGLKRTAESFKLK